MTVAMPRPPWFDRHSCVTGTPGSAMLPALFCPRTAVAACSLLWSHTHVRAVVPVSVKTPWGADRGCVHSAD